MSFKLYENQAEIAEEEMRGAVVAPRDDKEERVGQQPMAVEVLDYILTLTSELKAMAQQGGHDRLSRILTLAEEEARQQLGLRR